MVKINLSTLLIFLIVLMFYTHCNYTMLFRDVVDEGEPLKKVAESVEIKTTTLTPNQLEIERLKKERKYCSACSFSGNIMCEERLEYLQNKYGMEYLAGLKYVLEKGADCAKGR